MAAVILRMKACVGTSGPVVRALVDILHNPSIVCDADMMAIPHVPCCEKGAGARPHKDAGGVVPPQCPEGLLLRGFRAKLCHRRGLNKGMENRAWTLWRFDLRLGVWARGQDAAL